MRYLFQVLLLPLLSAATLGMVLGSLGYVGLFFWENREMCPCAPVGLVEAPETLIAAPLTREGMRSGMVTGALGGAVVGVVTALIFVWPSARRMGRMLEEDG